MSDHGPAIWVSSIPEIEDVPVDAVQVPFGLRRRRVGPRSRPNASPTSSASNRSGNGKLEDARSVQYLTAEEKAAVWDAKKQRYIYPAKGTR